MESHIWRYHCSFCGSCQISNTALLSSHCSLNHPRDQVSYRCSGTSSQGAALNREWYYRCLAVELFWLWNCSSLCGADVCQGWEGEAWASLVAETLGYGTIQLGKGVFHYIQVHLGTLSACQLHWGIDHLQFYASSSLDMPIQFISI